MKILLFTLAVVCSSCATLFHTPEYVLRVNAKSGRGSVLVEGKTYDMPALIPVKRSRAPLNLTLISDSTTAKHFILHPSLTNMFLLANIAYAPFTYLIDLTNPKRFHYGNVVVLDDKTRDSIVHVYSSAMKNYKSKELEPGDLAITLSVPYVNGFNLLADEYGRKRNSGFFGVNASLCYYHKRNRYLALYAGTSTDYRFPLPVSISNDGVFESMHALYVGFSHYHIVKRLHLGYGIHVSRNAWSEHFDGTWFRQPPDFTPVNRAHLTLGPAVGVDIEATKMFFIGGNYRPSFLKLSGGSEAIYEHLLTFDFGWRIPLN